MIRFSLDAAFKSADFWLGASLRAFREAWGAVGPGHLADAVRVIAARFVTVQTTRHRLFSLVSQQNKGATWKP
jgi:hypothetical protein